MRSRAWTGLACIAALATLPATASARRQSDLRYPFEQVWNASLRMVRVDLRMPVTDRDSEAGYMLFDYLDHGKRFPGSLELVRGDRDKGPATKIVVQVQGMPAYVEQMLLERLQQKLRSEFGEPMEPPRAPAQKPKQPEQKPPPPAEGDVPLAPTHEGLAPDS
ncbi:MAG TPA: hypothetical protein VFZ61_23015 [Polyangiales bacterium]